MDRLVNKDGRCIRLTVRKINLNGSIFDFTGYKNQDECDKANSSNPDLSKFAASTIPHRHINLKGLDISKELEALNTKIIAKLSEQEGFNSKEDWTIVTE